MSYMIVEDYNAEACVINCNGILWPEVFIPASSPAGLPNLSTYLCATLRKAE